MGIKYTPKQQQVIDARGRNVLVAAAAGSGKTAVLVERILQIISDADKPVDIDRLLIVTFTSAAASEMRERLSAAVSGRLQEMPENEHLQRQAALIHNAQITTIDSFCLFVIRNNFNDIGLDPGFRVADEGETKLMIQDTLRDMAEECFADKDEEFLFCLEALSAAGSEKPLLEYILQLDQFAMSFPWPMDWLEERRRDYSLENISQLEQTAWIRFIQQETGKVLTDCAQRMEEALKIAEQPDGPYMYGPLLETEAAALQKLAESAAGEYAEVLEALAHFTFGRLPGKKDETVDSEKKEAVKEIRNLIKDELAKLKDNFYYAEPRQLLEDMQIGGRLASKLIDLTIAFAEYFSGKKREKNIIDFHDMEHFALEILMRREGDTYRASQAALDYRAHFEEIMVDEYQDSNLVQEYLLKTVSGEDDGRFNRFMVGDVKQSIYKFRLARPEIFMEKYDTYPEEDNGMAQRIDLHKNFRSRAEVIDSVNLIFARIMGKQLGNVEYDDRAALYLGADYPGGGETCRTEMLLAQKGEDNPGWDKKEAEARMIASRIQELIGSFQVTDKESGKLRYASYRDIVILLRTNAGWDDVFKRVLNEYGIPVHTASKTGYFAASEIQTVLQFLRIVDNPLQDIPLYGVLKSPIGGFTENELARIKGSIPERSRKLYHILQEFVQQYAEEEEEKSLCQRISAFLGLLQKYRDMSVYMPIHRLIQNLLMETDYRNYASAFPAGEQRQANLRMLLQKAEDFEKTSFTGLFHFVRYIEQIEKYDIDYGEANTLDENADTVRIMSIHKSKGLEFPICFVSGISKRMNMTDSNKAVVMDVDLGIGVPCVKPEYRLKSTTLGRNVISRKLQLDSLGEELRVLYVALTRAKEKLILTGSISDFEKLRMGKLRLLSGCDGKIPYCVLTRAGSYLDFLLPVFLKEPELKNSLRVYLPEELESVQWAGRVSLAYRNRLLEGNMETKGAALDIDWLAQRFEAVYAHENLKKLYTKTTVSELKKAGLEETAEGAVVLYENEAEEEYLPRFIRPEVKMSGSTRGSAYHKVLELLDFETRDVEHFLTQKIQEKLLTQEYADCINPDKIDVFLQTSLAERMGRAERKGKLYREQPFVLGLPANSLNEEFPGEETVLIQGIIDAYFEEHGELVVVDYKTDRIKDSQELVQKYQKQLEYYAKALESLTGKRVKEKILYSFALGLEILLK